MMTIKEIYEQALKQAIKADLRGEQAVKNKLKKAAEKFKTLTKEQQAEFDQESLYNPYADSRFFAKNPEQKIKKILTGIDIDTGEVLLAKQLGVDLIISHHPMGIGLAGLSEVMDLQIELLALEGVPINVAQHLMQLRISEVRRSVDPANHYQALDAAKLLDLSVMCTHTFADNLVARYLKNLICKENKNIETVGEVLKLLKNIPEYKIAAQRKSGPSLFVGTPESYTGRIAILEMTGGTSGSKDIYEKLSQAGVGTIVGMHMHEEWRKEAEKHHINIIIAGHMASDSLGMNLMLDEIEKKGVEIIPCSGLIRVKRFKQK